MSHAAQTCWQPRAAKPFAPTIGRRVSSSRAHFVASLLLLCARQRTDGKSSLQSLSECCALVAGRDLVRVVRQVLNNIRLIRSSPFPQEQIQILDFLVDSKGITFTKTVLMITDFSISAVCFQTEIAQVVSAIDVFVCAHHLQFYVLIH